MSGDDGEVIKSDPVHSAIAKTALRIEEQRRRDELDERHGWTEFKRHKRLREETWQKSNA